MGTEAGAHAPLPPAPLPRLPPGRDLLLVRLGSLDVRRHSRFPSPVALAPAVSLPPGSALLVKVTVLLDSTALGAADAPIHFVIPMPTRNPEDDGGVLPFLLPAGALPAARVEIAVLAAAPEVDSNTDSRAPLLLAAGSSPPLAAAARESLWHEADPTIPGSLPIPLLTTASAYAGCTFVELVAVTHFDHPLAHAAGLTGAWPAMRLVGHRGAGMNGPLRAKAMPDAALRGLQIRENSLWSFATAHELGAEFVELDVQLMADGVPVIYHDYNDREVSDVTYDFFKSVRPAPHLSVPSGPGLTRSRSLGSRSAPLPGPQPKRVPKFEDLPIVMEPLCTLEEVLTRLPPSLGINIEFKYPLKEESEAERLHPPECNHYVDAILNVIMERAGDRPLLFSSFHPECALMLKLKQSRYPVYFLTMGGQHPTCDPRCNSLPAAAAFATRHGLEGIVTDARALGDPRTNPAAAADAVAAVRDRGLRLLTYGGLPAAGAAGAARALRRAGADGVIVDAVAAVSTTSSSPLAMGSHQGPRWYGTATFALGWACAGAARPFAATVSVYSVSARLVTQVQKVG
ncbi:Glycerophosphocholine phosphodiesterase [Cladochytrium tenue]|nr:Glycerophosphocholine phosphodiesterase [Cladochytrium tenue]